MNESARIQRFFQYVDFTDTCWNWQGGSARGYGKFWDGNKFGIAHRYSYSIFKGDLDPKLKIDHLCRNRGCVNPEHLEQVTNKENILRGVSYAAMCARRTHCGRGHEYTASNTYLRAPNDRICRICRRAYVKTSNLRRKEAIS